jgi:hypothetical protein
MAQGFEKTLVDLLSKQQQPQLQLGQLLRLVEQQLL